MGALATAIAASTPRKGPICTVPGVRDRLTKADRADLDTAMADPLVAATAIAAGMKTLGLQVGADSLRRHRRGICGCAR